MTKCYFLQKYISILYLYKKLTSKVQKYIYTHTLHVRIYCTSWFNSASLNTENDLEKFSKIIYKKLYL